MIGFKSVSEEIKHNTRSVDYTYTVSLLIIMRNHMMCQLFLSFSFLQWTSFMKSPLSLPFPSYLLPLLCPSLLFSSFPPSLSSLPPVSPRIFVILSKHPPVSLSFYISLSLSFFSTVFLNPIPSDRLRIDSNPGNDSHLSRYFRAANPEPEPELPNRCLTVGRMRSHEN